MTPPTSEPVPPAAASRFVERSPVHYGWVVLAAGTVGMAMTIPGQTVGVSVFLDRIIDDLELSRSAVSAAYTVGTLLGSLTLPFVGRAVDRHGPRRAVIVIALLFAFACGTVGLAQGLVTLLLGFTLIRGLGQGALSLVSMHAVNIWFVRRRGVAMGLAGVGFAIATAAAPFGIEALIASFDWRWAYGVLGLAVAVVMVPVGGGLFRHRPEHYGVLPDGYRPPALRRRQRPERHFTLQEARRTVTFWLYVTGGFLTSGLGTGLVFHHFSIMNQNGLGRPEAATMFVSYGLVTAGAALAAGYLVDRMPPRFLLGVAQGLMAAAMLMATRVTSVGAIIAYGVALGCMQGMSQALQSTVYAYYFGRVHLGAIKGLSATITIAGAAVGPLLLSVGFDVAGSYAPVLALAAVLPVALAVTAPFLPLVRDDRIL